jgi:pilus assembly protein CpaC
MRKFLSHVAGVVFAVIMSGVIAYDSQPATSGSLSGEAPHAGVLDIPRGTRFPMVKKLTIGTGKSLLLQFPIELRDVLVSDPERVDAVVQTSNRVFLIAKKQGQVNAFFFDSLGQQVLQLELTVGTDLGDVEDLVRRLIPGSNVKVEVAGSAMVLTGSVRTPLDSTRAADIAKEFLKADTNLSGSRSATSSSAPAGTAPQFTITTQSGAAGGSVGAGDRKVINLLTVEGEEQVMLRVTVAEVQRSMLKQFGINLAASINAGNLALGLMTDNALPLTSAAGLGKLPVPGFNPTIDATNMCSGVTCFYNTGPTAGTFGNSGLDGGWSSGRQSFRQAMRMLERNGLVKTLAEPNLTAVSGEPAKFLAGGEYPVPMVDSTGQVSIAFKEFGVGVAFTPIVMTEGRISLKIEAEVSELTNDGSVTLANIQIPALKKRSSKSTVELPSGGSLAIAGLISEDTRQNIDGLPGLKDVPVLGTLFRSHDFIKSETELVIIVTPYIVKPTARQQLARPLDGLAEPTDLKANLLGHINRVYGRAPSMPVGDLKGDYGFIVE